MFTLDGGPDWDSCLPRVVALTQTDVYPGWYPWPRLMFTLGGTLDSGSCLPRVVALTQAHVYPGWYSWPRLMFTLGGGSDSDWCLPWVVPLTVVLVFRLLKSGLVSGFYWDGRSEWRIATNIKNPFMCETIAHLWHRVTTLLELQQYNQSFLNSCYPAKLLWGPHSSRVVTCQRGAINQRPNNPYRFNRHQVKSTVKYLPYRDM